MSLKEYFFKFSFIYNLFPLKFLMKLSGKKIIFPFYHFVDNGDNQIVNNLYKPKNTREFEDDIIYLKKYFQSISLDNILENQIKQNSFFLSFDDGLANYINTVIPILEKHNLKSINFLNSNFIDNKSLFFRYKVNVLISEINRKELTPKQKTLLDNIVKSSGSITVFLKKLTQKDEAIIDNVASILNFSFHNFLNQTQPYLSEFQIKKLIDKGFYFGSHSKSHPYYYTIPIEEQIEETLNCIETLEIRFGLQNKLFAFPFSDFGVSKRFFEIMKKNHVLSFGTAGIKDESTSINNYQRIVMEYENKVYSAETIIKGELILYLVKRVFKKHRIYRK